MYTFLLQTAPMEFSSGAASQPASQMATQPESIPLVTMLVAGGVAVCIIGWFGVRFWLGMNRPSAIGEVKTPAINRLNANALEKLVGESSEEAEADLEAMQHEPAPDDLLDAIPSEEVEIKEIKPREPDKG